MVVTALRKQRVRMKIESTENHRLNPWTVIPYIGLALIFAILYFQYRADLNRDAAQDHYDRMVTAARTQYTKDTLTYQLDLYERLDCVNGVTTIADIRANWIALANELEKRWGEAVQELVAVLRNNIEKNTPRQYVGNCPPVPTVPKIPKILIVEDLNGNRADTSSVFD